MTDSWDEYRKLILSELERLSRRADDIERKVDVRANAIEDKVDSLRMDMMGIKAKATAYGSIAGIIFGALTAVVAKAFIK